MSKKTEKSLKKGLKRKIIQVLSESTTNSYNSKQVAKALGFHQPMKKKLVHQIMEDMHRDNVIIPKNNGFVMASSFSSNEESLNSLPKGVPIFC